MGILEPKFVAEICVEELGVERKFWRCVHKCLLCSFSLSCWQLLDGKSGLNDSVQQMVIWTTFALKMGVCLSGIWVSSTQLYSQLWVSELLYDSNSLLFLFFTVKFYLILISVLRKSSLLIFKHSILTNNYLK